MTRQPLRTLFAVTLLAGTALGGMSALAQENKAGAIQPPQLSHPLPDFVGLVKQVKPAVVSITVKMTDDGEEGEGGFPGHGGQGGASPFGNMPFPMPFPFGQQQHPRTVEARRLRLPDRCRRHDCHQQPRRQERQICQRDAG